MTYTDEQIQEFISVRECHMDGEPAEIIRQLLAERDEARAEVENLKHDIERYITIASELATENQHAE